jgi:hypothetical protein
LSGKVPLGVRGEKRLNTTGLAHSLVAILTELPRHVRNVILHEKFVNDCYMNTVLGYLSGYIELHH